MTTGQFQAQFRPLVKSAWARHCIDLGLDPSDDISYRAWYEDKLISIAEIRSTRHAHPSDYAALLSAFALLCGCQQVEISGFSDAQNSALSGVAARAYVAKRRLETFATWLDMQLESCGIWGRSAPDHGKTFDAIMGLLATVAGDKRWIARTSAAAETRLRHVLVEKLDRLSNLSGRDLSWDYCRSIYNRMGLPLTPEEAPAELLRKVLAALDTQLRRHEKNLEPAPF
jgi:hypothetical protein